MSAGYVIQVGNEKPAEAIIATPHKKTGDPQGPQMKTYIRVGSHLILNRARVWGRRVINGKPKADQTDIEFNTVGYKGEVEFLPWGKEGGYAIDIRYLPQSRSLDYEYQQNVQKIQVNPEQEGAHVRLNAGQNKFDPSKQDILVKFLGVHPQNRDSKSKNPDPVIKGYQYYEVTDEHVDKKAVEKIETAIQAGNMIKELSGKPNQVRNLFKVMGKREEFGSTDLLSGDAQIYRTMLEYASGNSEDFFYLIGEYKREVEDAFKKADSYQALDLTKEGHVVMDVSGKKTIILSEVPGKGQGMVDWMIQHYYEEEVFMATQTLKELVSKLK